MNQQFDELTRDLAQSVTRRGALKKFSVGLTGIALAILGVARKARADRGGCRPYGQKCVHDSQCCSGICVTYGQKSGYCGL